MNNLTIEVYSSGTTRIADPGNDLAKAQGLRFATGYPGGLYLDGSFYIPRDALKFLSISGSMRVIFRNGQNIVYEGWVDGEISNFTETDQGIEIPLIGTWGRYLMRRYIRKMWADNRVSDDVWKYTPSPTGEPYFDVSRLTDAGPALLFSPNSFSMGSTFYAQCVYTMPTGETVKKITCDYELATDGSAPVWGLYLVNGTSGASIGTFATRTTAGTTTGGSATAFNLTLGTPVNSVAIRLQSGTAQTPLGNGGVYGEITDLLVYSETSNINLTEIVKDVRAANGNFNTDESYIASITDTGGIIPFVIDRWTTHANVLMEAAGYGDDSYNKWAVGVLHSERAATSNGLPVIYAEQQPALTDYDYAIRVDENNLVAPFGLERDYSNIWNSIVVEYYDESGNYTDITPDDGTHTGLEDLTSGLGKRQYILSVGNSTADAAYDSGRRFLAQWKDPQYKLNGPITVSGYIRAKSGVLVPACEIVAGKRVKIENYLNDLSGTGLTFLISHTEYDDESETCSIQAGIPDDLIFPTFTFDPVGRAPGPPPEVEGADGGRSRNPDRLNWKRQYGLVEGTKEWEEAVRMGKHAWRNKYKDRKRVKK